MRKILYSPGFGAGWTSWNDGEVGKYMLTYEPIISFIDGGGKFTYDDCQDSSLHPLLKQLKKECKEKFDEDYVCILGATDLKVAKVTGRVLISEYDGSESFEEESNFSGWM